MAQTLRSLLNSVDANDTEIIAKFTQAHPECEGVLEDLPAIIDYLRTCELPSDQGNYPNTSIWIRQEAYTSGEGTFMNVSGVENGDKETTEALGTAPWGVWLVMPIESDLDDMSTLVECIYEMTVYGPDDAFQRSRGLAPERVKFVTFDAVDDQDCFESDEPEAPEESEQSFCVIN